jgi:hypothetical protein
MELVVSSRNSRSVEQTLLNSPVVLRGDTVALALSTALSIWRTRCFDSAADRDAGLPTALGRERTESGGVG